MIYALVGQSASGKSTVERALVEVHGYKRVISYTTRPMRENEKDGVDYHFIDVETFQRLASDGFFAETAKYRDWNYGLSLGGIDYKDDDCIVVVTVHGYNEIVKAVGCEYVTGIHIKVKERERIVRQLKRGDEVDEVFRRIYADRVDFADVESACKYVIQNNRLDITIEKVLNVIEIKEKREGR